MRDYEAAFREALKKIEDVGTQYAEAKAQSWQLQELKQVILSEELLKADGKTVGEREAQARVSQAFRSYLDGAKEAIHKEHKLKVLYEKAYATYEALRSLSSQQTAQMKMGV